MPISRQEKADLVHELTEELKQAQGVIITDYRGLPVADLQTLRRELRGMHASYHIAKNTLLTLALKEAGLPAPESLLDGPTAVAFLGEDIAGPAKRLSAFFKDKNLPIKGAILGQSVYDAQGVQDLSQLPTRGELYAQFLGSLQAPASNLVGVLNGVLQQLVSVLQAKAEQAA